MKTGDVEKRLCDTGIRVEDERVVPINGFSVSLPYMVIRKNSTVIGSDNGRVQYEKTSWIVALFSANRDQKAEAKISAALAPVGRFEISHFPDGEIYQTDFEFSTNQIVKRRT